MRHRYLAKNWNPRGHRGGTYSKSMSKLHELFPTADSLLELTPEDLVQREYKATIRCLPFDGPTEPGTCLFTGKPSPRRVVFARAY